MANRVTAFVLMSMGRNLIGGWRGMIILVFLGEIFQTQTQNKDGWLDQSNKNMTWLNQCQKFLTQTHHQIYLMFFIAHLGKNFTIVICMYNIIEFLNKRRYL